MAGFFLHPMLVLLAGIVNSELQERLEYLIVENRILRSKLGKRVRLSPCERNRLLLFGAPLGPALKDLISIVTYKTFRRWMKEHIFIDKEGITGRPPIPESIRNLILRMASDNPGWGFRRILGELKKLNIEISRASIQNILRKYGPGPAPERNDYRWRKLIQSHIDSLIACDFFTKDIWTIGGRITIYVFFFIELKTRRVHLAGITRYPKRDWVERRAEETLDIMETSFDFKPEYLIRDRDGKFSGHFDEIMNDHGVNVLKIPPRKAVCNSFAERWVRSVKYECLNHFVVFGRRHLTYILSSYLDYYNKLRPHQGIGNVPLESPTESPPTGDIEQISILGGLFHHYYRKSA